MFSLTLTDSGEKRSLHCKTPEEPKSRSRSESSKPRGQVSSDPALQREVTLGESKCEGMRILKVRVPKSSQSSIGRDVWQKICHFRGKLLREKRECVEQELSKVGEPEFI
jgi:hypothetical protein